MKIEAFILYAALILWVVIYPLRTQSTNSDPTGMEYHTNSLYIRENMESGNLNVYVWIKRKSGNSYDTPIQKIRCAKSLEEILRFLEIETASSHEFDDGIELVNNP